jgi:hypothetical protein
VEVYGEHGRYGTLFPVPASSSGDGDGDGDGAVSGGALRPSSATLSSLLGVNGIWGFENQGWSSEVLIVRYVFTFRKSLHT